MRIVLIGGLAAAGVLLSGCATITRGTSQKFNIQSNPSEAQVALSTGEKCTTPCKLKLKRKAGFTATFTKQGYKTKEAKVESELHGGGAAAGAGNILIGGVIGGLVDGSNGSLKSLSPNPLVVELEPEAILAPAAATVAAEPADAAPAASSTEVAPAAATPTVDTGQPGNE